MHDKCITNVGPNFHVPLESKINNFILYTGFSSQFISILYTIFYTLHIYTTYYTVCILHVYYILDSIYFDFFPELRWIIINVISPNPFYLPSSSSLPHCVFQHSPKRNCTLFIWYHHSTCSPLKHQILHFTALSQWGDPYHFSLGCWHCSEVVYHLLNMLLITVKWECLGMVSPDKIIVIIASESGEQVFPIFLYLTVSAMWFMSHSWFSVRN